MSKKVVSTALIALLIVSNVVWIASWISWKRNPPAVCAGLDVVQRDVVIRELTQLLNKKYRDYSQQQVLEELSNDFPPQMIEFDSEYVYFGATVKFKFDNDRLSVIYW